jgi:hypothetical protein
LHICEQELTHSITNFSKKIAVGVANQAVHVEIAKRAAKKTLMLVKKLLKHNLF